MLVALSHLLPPRLRTVLPLLLLPLLTPPPAGPAHAAHAATPATAAPPLCRRVAQPPSPQVTSITDTGQTLQISGFGFSPGGQVLVLSIDSLSSSPALFSSYPPLQADTHGRLVHAALPLSLPVAPGLAEIWLEDLESGRLVGPVPFTAPATTVPAPPGPPVPSATPLPTALPAIHLSAPLPQVARVLVDQPSGTLLALSDPTTAVTMRATLGLRPALVPRRFPGTLTALDARTGTAPAWLPPGPGWLVGTAWPLAGSNGRVLLTCGHGLVQLDAAGHPHPFPWQSPLPGVDAQWAEDPALHRVVLVNEPVASQPLVTGQPAANEPVVIADTQQGKVVARGAIPGAGPVAVDPASGQAVVAGTAALTGTYTVHWLDLRTGRQGRVLTGHVPDPSDTVVTPVQVAVDAPAHRLVLLSCGVNLAQLTGTAPPSNAWPLFVQVVNLRTDHFVQQPAQEAGSCRPTAFPLYPSLDRLEFGASGGLLGIDETARVAVVASERPTIRVPGEVLLVPLRSGHAGRCVQVGQLPSAVAVDGTLHRAYVADTSGTVTVLDTRTGQVEAVVPVGGEATDVAVEEQAGQVVVALDGPLGQTGLATFPATITTSPAPPTVPC